MAYAPNTASQNAPLAGNSTFWSNLVANHDELYLIEPPICEISRTTTYGQPTTDLKAWRWRVRGNLDMQTIRCRLRGSGTGSPTVTMHLNGIASTPATLAADNWHHLAVTPTWPAAVSDVYLEVDVPAGVGNTASITRFYSHVYNPTGPTDTEAQRPSGFVNNDGLATADWPVSVEHVERLRNGPVQMARERPVCVFCHLAPCLEPQVTTSANDFARWLAEDVAYAKLVGRGYLPRLSYGSTRRYVIDAFVSVGAGGDTPVATLQVGGFSWQLPVCGTWQSVEVDLPDGPHEVLASINPGASTIAQFDAVQIWRL